MCLYWLCIIIDGETKSYYSTEANMKHNFKDITGQKFNSLTVTSFAYRDERGENTLELYLQLRKADNHNRIPFEKRKNEKLRLFAKQD